MSGRANYQLRDYSLSAFTSSIGATPVSAYMPVPMDAELMMTNVTPYGAITTADSTLTVSVLPGGVVANAVTVGVTVVVPVSGAAAGTFATATHTTNRAVRAGDVVRITPAGASGANIAAMVVCEFRR